MIILAYLITSGHPYDCRNIWKWILNISAPTNVAKYFSQRMPTKKWITTDQNLFVNATAACCSLLKCFLAKHCFPKDVEWNLTQQKEKHETLLWHKETRSRFKAGLGMRSLAARKTLQDYNISVLQCFIFWQYDFTEIRSSESFVEVVRLA